jgi:hypothetical protein
MLFFCNICLQKVCSDKQNAFDDTNYYHFLAEDLNTNKNAYLLSYAVRFTAFSMITRSTKMLSPIC